MLVQDGLFVYVPKNVVLERPLQIVNVLRADVDLMANRRVLVVLEEGASAQLLVCDHAMDERRRTRFAAASATCLCVRRPTARALSTTSA